MNLGQQISYIQLLQRHTHIQIPIIQRDYAQGWQQRSVPRHG